MSKNSSQAKPLKGSSIQADSIVVSNLSATDLVLTPEATAGLLQGAYLDNVIITNSEINNSIIGANGNNSAFFSQLTTTGDITFYGLQSPERVFWDSGAGILNIKGELKLDGCATIGNISICENTISAVSPANGDINFLPKNLGKLNLTGPITNIVSSQGSYLSSLANGNYTVLASDYLKLISNYSGVTIGSFNSQLLRTLNGDITLQTETGVSTKNISDIVIDGSLRVQITSPVDTNLNVGDTITISNTNSVPAVNGIFTVTSIIDKNKFTISTNGNALFSSGNIGSYIKQLSNNINLISKNYVTIPTDIPLTFGITSSSTNLNSIKGNTTGMYINSQGDINLNVSSSNSVIIPSVSKLQLGSSYLNFDNNSLNIISSSTGQVIVTGSQSNILTTNTRFYDPNPMIGYTSNTNGNNPDSLNTFGDDSDRGISFQYFTAGSLKLGWFGYKTDKGQFVFLTDATNTNETMTGTPGNFNISAISADTITINGILNMACSPIQNVSLMTGCGGTVNINGSNNVNISAASTIKLIAGTSVNIPNNIPITIGTSGSSIKENTNGNLVLSSNSILLNSSYTIISSGNKLTFDGNSTSSTNFIVSDTSSNFFVNSNKNLYLLPSSGNIIVPVSGSLTTGSIQFGTSTTPTQIISGNSSGISLLSSSGYINLISNTSVNISSSSGNILLSTRTGDIQLYSSTGNVRINPASYLVFGTTGTTGSIRINTTGNLIVTGPGTSGSSNVTILNTADINLTANSTVNVPTNVKLNVGNSFIVSTVGNLVLSNTTSTLINSISTTLSNTGGSLFVTNVTQNNINTVTNITSQNFTITGNKTSGSVITLDTQNVKIYDPIISLGFTAGITTGNINSNSLTDRGIEYSYLNSSGNLSLGWFGYKSNTGVFAFYQNATNNNEIITGTLGQFQLGSALVANSLIFTATGGSTFIDMSCGTIANVNTITGCGGTINLYAPNTLNASANNINLSANTVLVPTGTPLNFGTTGNNIISDSSGNMTISVLNGSGNLILNSNVQINGTTNNVYSTVTNIRDPIISLGGYSSGSIINDNNDRGIEFKWSDGITNKTGFFGYNNALGAFEFIPNGINTNEVFSGSYGNCYFAKGNFTNVDVACGTVSNVNTLIGCNGAQLNIISTNTMFSSGNVILPFRSSINFGNTSASSISGSSNGNISITSQSGGISLITNTSGNGFVNISGNTPLNFGTGGTYIVKDTSGTLNIINSSGNINLSPVSGGTIYTPINNKLAFGSQTGGSTNYITSDGTQLQLFGYESIGINSSTVTIAGNVNILGSISASAVQSNSNDYMLPLGTSQILTITNIANTTTTGSISITTATPNYLRIGDSITVKNTNSTPVIDGTFIVSGVINDSTIVVPNGTLSAPGSSGTLTSVLTSYQGKDVGVMVQYWSTVGNTSVTSGSQNYRTGFFGWMHGTEQWTFYNQATIANNVVTQGVLGDISINKLLTNSIGNTSSSVILSTTLTGGNVYPSYLQVNSGLIDNTPIGQTIAQTGRFTNLGTTISANLTNLTLSSTLNYSIDRFTCSSSNQFQNPRIDTVVSFVSLTGSGTSCSGTMGTTGVADGQIKKIIMSSVVFNAGNTYTLFFGTNKLITPNPLGGTPTKIEFKRQGQSCEIVYDAAFGNWVLTGGTAYVQ
jgi:hypothetical protein